MITAQQTRSTNDQLINTRMFGGLITKKKLTQTQTIDDRSIYSLVKINRKLVS